MQPTKTPQLGCTVGSRRMVVGASEVVPQPVLVYLGRANLVIMCVTKIWRGLQGGLRGAQASPYRRRAAEAGDRVRPDRLLRQRLLPVCSCPRRSPGTGCCRSSPLRDYGVFVANEGGGKGGPSTCKETSPVRACMNVTRSCISCSVSPNGCMSGESHGLGVPPLL
jgi:hypothetical protein